MRIAFVHGACVRDGSWWWYRTAELLQQREVASVAPALPSCGEAGLPAGAGGPGLPEDVAAVRQVLQNSDEPTVVVARSYGGIVTAEAAAGVASVRHLLLVASYLPEVGQPVGLRRRQPRPVPGRRPRRRHLWSSPRAARGHVPAGLRPRDPSAGDGPPRPAERAGHRPAGRSGRLAAGALEYLVCTKDRGTPARLQREFARRAGSVVEIEAGHHPFLSQPAAVRDLLLSL